MIRGLAERLKEIRIKLNYSQREVARQLYVSPSIISGYETGERTPSAENLLALSRLYRCSIDYLLGKDPAEPAMTLVVEWLSQEQVHILQELIEVFRSQKVPTVNLFVLLSRKSGQIFFIKSKEKFREIGNLKALEPAFY